MPDQRYLRLIEQRSQDFADHENMTLARLIRWFDQFNLHDQPMAGKILEVIDYFAIPRIRGMSKQLVDLVLAELSGAREDALYFIPVGGVYESSRVIARAIRDIQRRTRARWQICSMADVERLEPNEVDALIFVDDFSGTGNSLSTWWSEVEPLVLPKDAKIIVALLVLNDPARSAILQFADDVICIQELDDTHNAFSTSCCHFNDSDRNLLLKYCVRTGASRKYVKGYGDCGLLIAFKHGCPNNSLPLLWWESGTWESLFLRYGL